MQQRMRADMATEMAELRDSALLHCKGMRKIASTQVSVSYCGICFDKEVSDYICQQCPYAVCIRCFSMAFQTRVYSVDSSIDYTCPYCIQTFASFPEVSIDLGEHGDEQEQVTGRGRSQMPISTLPTFTRSMLIGQPNPSPIP